MQFPIPQITELLHHSFRPNELVCLRDLLSTVSAIQVSDYKKKKEEGKNPRPSVKHKKVKEYAVFINPNKSAYVYVCY